MSVGVCGCAYGQLSGFVPFVLQGGTQRCLQKKKFKLYLRPNYLIQINILTLRNYAIIIPLLRVYGPIFIWIILKIKKFRLLLTKVSTIKIIYVEICSAAAPRLFKTFCVAGAAACRLFKIVCSQCSSS